MELFGEVAADLFVWDVIARPIAKLLLFAVILITLTLLL